jgi:hypothetical protein
MYPAHGGSAVKFAVAVTPAALPVPVPHPVPGANASAFDAKPSEVAARASDAASSPRRVGDLVGLDICYLFR